MMGEAMLWRRRIRQKWDQRAGERAKLLSSGGSSGGMCERQAVVCIQNPAAATQVDDGSATSVGVCLLLFLKKLDIA